jgi:hypothetical protein
MAAGAVAGAAEATPPDSAGESLGSEAPAQETAAPPDGEAPAKTASAEAEG